MTEEPQNKPIQTEAEVDADWQALPTYGELDKDPLGIIPSESEVGDLHATAFNPDTTDPARPKTVEDVSLEAAYREGYQIARRAFDQVKAGANQRNAEDELDKRGHKIRNLIEENNLASKTLFDLTQENIRLREENTRLTPLAEMAFVDDLTQIKNRRGLRNAYDELAKDHMRHASRSKEDYITSILYIDLDGFKGANDTLGHGAGDELLTYIAQRFKGRLRDTDIIGRIGGDEFLAFVPDTTVEEAMELAGVLKDIVKYGAGELNGKRTGLGASIGVAKLDPNKPFEEVIALADAALIQAKEEGKDRVVMFNGAAN